MIRNREKILEKKRSEVDKIILDNIEDIKQKLRDRVRIVNIAKEYGLSYVVFRDAIKRILGEGIYNESVIIGTDKMVIDKGVQDKMVNLFLSLVSINKISDMMGISEVIVKRVLLDRLGEERYNKVIGRIVERSKTKLDRKIFTGYTLEDKVWYLYYRKGKGIEDIAEVLDIDKKEVANIIESIKSGGEVGK